MEEKIHHLEQGVLSGNREAVRTACRQLLEAGMPPQKIVDSDFCRAWTRSANSCPAARNSSRRS